MGVDVNLYAEADPSPERLAMCEAAFHARCNIADRYQPEKGEGWLSLQYDDSEWNARPRVVANVTTRYYGQGYERGDWPSIYGAIRLLAALFPEAKVYYGGDSSDDGEECTPEFLAEMWDHFTGPHGDDYRSLGLGVYGGNGTGAEWPVRAETQPTTPRARECETGDNAEEAQQ